MLDHRLLCTFVCVADTGSFTGAAKKLHITQSTVSQQLMRLEEAVGHELISRSARHAQLTSAGERLLQYARQILLLQLEAVTLLSNPVGIVPVRIGLPDDIVTAKMNRTFATFSRQHREVRLDVTTGLSRDLSRRFRAGEFDVVVVKEPSAAADHCASFPEAIGWFESTGSSGNWSDPVPLVTFSADGLYRETMFDRLERERRCWYIAFTGCSLRSALTAVEAGLGLSLVPVGATADYGVQPHVLLGMEPAMAVSIYSREKTGRIGELVARMTEVLQDRHKVHVER